MTAGNLGEKEVSASLLEVAVLQGLPRQFLSEVDRPFSSFSVVTLPKANWSVIDSGFSFGNCGRSVLGFVFLFAGSLE